jgi:hypothetical protein
VEQRLERAFAMLTDLRCLHLVSPSRPALAMCPIPTACSAGRRHALNESDSATRESYKHTATSFASRTERQSSARSDADSGAVAPAAADADSGIVCDSLRRAVATRAGPCSFPLWARPNCSSATLTLTGARQDHGIRKAPLDRQLSQPLT